MVQFLFCYFNFGFAGLISKEGRVFDGLCSLVGECGLIQCYFSTTADDDDVGFIAL